MEGVNLLAGEALQGGFQEEEAVPGLQPVFIFGAVQPRSQFRHRQPRTRVAWEWPDSAV